MVKNNLKDNKAVTISIDFLTSKRMQSLYWRTGAMLFSGAGALAIENLTVWDADSMITVFAGLIIGEITKKLNSKK